MKKSWTYSSYLLLLFNIINAQAISSHDPWETFNRSVFAFNEVLDNYILRPVAIKYSKYTPKPVQNMTSNFFANLGDIRNFINLLLQLNLKDASITLFRLMINSTVGQLGFVDVASFLGFKKHYQDFGITLAKWGFPAGPYLVLPFWGPSTLRSTIGLLPDHYTYAPNYAKWPVDIKLTAIKVIDTRSSLLNHENLITGDRYVFIRDSYLQNRFFKITGKTQNDDF